MSRPEPGAGHERASGVAAGVLEGGSAATNPADERVALGVLVPLAVQHLLVMITGPISSVFLVSNALQLDAQTSGRLLSAFFLVSAIGTIVQSTGPLGVGSRLPFVMLPGGAAVVLFIQVAQQTSPQTATGAVLLTSVCCLLLVPVFLRIVRFFPPLVIGVMVVVIGVNLLRITAGLVLDPAGGAEAGALALMGFTIAVTVLCFRFLPGGWARISVLLGLVIGALAASVFGQHGSTDRSQLLAGPVLAGPALLPFGRPEFNLLATVPMLIFAIGAMAEATGQTVLNTEAVGKPLDFRRDVGGTLRGDVVTSLLAGLVGGPIMVTSGENIGIVRISAVRSRFVTLGTGVLLAAIAFLAPVARLVNTIPAAVIAGTGVVVFAMIAALGIRMLAQVDLGRDDNLLVATLALVAGLIPVVAPKIYGELPPGLRLVLGSGVTMATLVGVLGNLLFRAGRRPNADDGAKP